MALAYSSLGTVDRPSIVDGDSGAPRDLKCRVFDVTIGVTSDDYVTSLGGVVVAASAAGMNQLLWAGGSIRGSTGALKTNMVVRWDATFSSMRALWRADAGSGGTAAQLSEVAASNLANGDVIRVLAVGV